ncbi:4Fe-4S binding protein [Carboxydocella sp. JDF658]|uniref:4Fe-4S binding protein n=1 Tax=Carboxydocella sp. JDF658 TaxID=1926600 RepID=UPI0013566C1F|nr:4Fe-4S dicluster domain-containing protein [Carboxydocella sp. JDF658]
MKEKIKQILAKRAKIQWFLALGFIALNGVLFFVTPRAAYIPFFVLPLMIISVFFWSRAFCGWACPRAAFLERILSKVSLNKPVPKWMNYYWVSALVFIVLISRVTYVGFTRGLLAAGFLLCLVPTIGALVVGWYSPKSWCAICPTGTLLKTLDRLQIARFKIAKEGKCTSCGACDRVCPMGVEPSKVPLNSGIEQMNCTQCAICTASCPYNSLHLPERLNNHIKQGVAVR